MFSFIYLVRDHKLSGNFPFIVLKTLNVMIKKKLDEKKLKIDGFFIKNFILQIK